MISTSELVEQYVRKRPQLLETLEKDVINYSALARLIQEEIKELREEERSFASIKMALVRNSDKLIEERKRDRKNIQKVLNETQVEVQNKVCVVHSRIKLEISSIIFSKTESGYTYVVDEKVYENLDKRKLMKNLTDQYLITLRSNFDLERVSGVLGYILSSLAARHINITEIISCREDTHLLVSGEDASDSFEVISEML